MSISGWLLVAAVLLVSGEPVATLTQLRALVDAGRYVDAEQQGLARVAALDATQGTPSQRDTNLAIADTLDLVVLARHLGRRLTQPNTVQLAERALQLEEAALGPDDVRVAATLVLLGVARAAHRQPEDGQADVKRALAIRERVLGADHVDVANALNALAWIERSRNSDATATPFAWRAYDIARLAEQPAGRETDAALVGIGTHMRNTGDSPRAIEIFEEALAIEERIYGPTHPASVITLTQLGAAYFNNGDVARGMATRGRAISLLEATPGSELRLAFELMSDSNWLAAAGDFGASLATAERAVAVAERVSGPSSALTAGALEQLAVAYTRLGDDATAAAIGRRTVALWTATQGPDAIHTATAWRALAESYEQAGQIDAAFEAIQHAVSSPSLAKEYILFAQALQVQARLLMTRGRLDEARAVLERARHVSESGTFSIARTDLATTLMLLARIERQDGHLARALPLYREAVVRYEIVLGYAHPTVADWRIEFAGALAEVGELYEAWQLLASGEHESLEHLRLVARTLTDDAALSFAATRMSGIDLAVSLAVSPLPHQEDSQDVTRAFDMLIHSRTVVLDELAARQRSVVEQVHDAQVRTRWEALTHARTRLANAIVRGPGDQSTADYQASIDAARAARDQAERDLAQASATFRQEQQRSRAGRAAVLANLPPGAAIVSYVRYTPQALPVPLQNAAAIGDRRDAQPAAYAAFVMRAGREAVTVVPLGAADRIDHAIAAWREAVRRELISAGLAARRNEAAYREAGAALRALVWDPVSSQVGGAATVFVVPDGALHQVDLATLPVGRTAYLVDAPFVLHYLLAERDLVQPPAPSSSGSLLALGAPDFDRVERVERVERAAFASPVAPVSTAPAPAAQTAARSTAFPLSRYASAVCEASLASRFDPLPATGDELQHIARTWRQGDVVMLGGARASETAFKALARGRRVLHIATHGFFLDRYCSAPATPGSASSPVSLVVPVSPAAAGAAAPGGAAGVTSGSTGEPVSAPGRRLLEESPLLRAGLILAGANQRAPANSDEDDGILTAEEIVSLDLSGAQWAVLSACDTGRGDWQAGEGVLGLRRAFQVAGARTVILSLWPVLDTVTSTWMTELYRGRFVRGTTTAAAVRAANRMLLAARRAHGLSTHPLYWSGFIATGDWR